MGEAKSVDDKVKFERNDKDHPNWKDVGIMNDFLVPLCDFYVDEYLPELKDSLEGEGINNFLYVGNGFVGLGTLDNEKIDVFPYCSEKRFFLVLDHLVDSVGYIKVVIPISKDTKRLQEMMEKAKTHANLDYREGILGPRPEDFSLQ